MRQFYPEARLQWLEQILFERFGINMALSQLTPCSLRLEIPGAEGYVVFDNLIEGFSDTGVSLGCGHWSPQSEGFDSMIEEPLPMPTASKADAPCLVQQMVGGSVVHYDILGMTYWMLSRLEEVGNPPLDEYQRFSFKSSHAVRYGYVGRPIVDEWLFILKQIVSKQWPGIHFKQHHFKMNISHDVDMPSKYGFLKPKRMLRYMLSHLLKQGNIHEPARILYHRLKTKERLLSEDPFNTFDFLMSLSEQHGLRSTFYFMCGKTSAHYDGHYRITHPAIKKLLTEIHQRGHEIGLHPSYDTFLDYNQLSKESDTLKELCHQLGIYQLGWGGRMHYLRWQHPQTLNLLDKLGLDYDATLGYANVIGFRCGTCHEYTAFDPVNYQPKKIRIRPMIVMDSAVISLHTTDPEKISCAGNKIKSFKSICEKFKGQFSLLWHNSSLETPLFKEMYMDLLM